MSGGYILSKKLIVGLILCFCFDAALACSNDELKVVESSSPRYKVNSCLRKGTVLILDAKQCVSLKHNNGLKTKKCGEYSDKEGIMGFIERIISMLAKSTIKDSCDFLDMGKIQNFVFCIIKSPYRLFFYREDARFVGSFTIVDDKNNKSYTYHWQKGENTFPWPSKEFPIQKGTNYHIKTEVSNSWESFSFRQKSAANSENYWVLDWGCLSKVEGVKATVGPIKSEPLN